MALAHFQRTFTDTTGNVRPSLSITIRNESNGAKAAIFADSAGNTPKDNPFTTDAFGYGDFYVADGRYRIIATGIDWRNESVISFDSLAAAVQDAEDAAQAAALNAGIYADTTEGLANTVDGDYFSTPAAGADEYLTLYRNDAGVATEIDTYPNKTAIDTVTEALDARAIYVGSVLALPATAIEGQIAIVSGSGEDDGNYQYQSGSWVRTTGNAINKDYGTGTDNLLRVVDFENRYKSLTLVGSVDYGQIILPSDFENNLDFNLWRDVNGTIQHDFDVDTVSGEYTQYYVSQFGEETNDGLTPSTPRKALFSLMDDIEADAGVSSAKITIISDYMTRDYNYVSLSPITKNYHIEAGNSSGVVNMGPIERGLSWTLHSAGVYQTTRSSTRNVFDSRFPSFHGLPQQLEQVDTLTECESTKSTWFTDGSAVYVHLKDGVEPDNDLVYVCVSATVMQYNLGADATAIFTGFNYLCGGSSQPFYFNGGTTVTQGKVILQKVKAVGTIGTANGISTDAVKSIWLFDCVSRDHGADGFNYHSEIDGDTFAFEYNCLAEKCGESGEISENATTAHDGMRILRIASKGGQTWGPVLADVNGCYTICYDCEMGESLRGPDGTPQKAAYRFSDSASPHDANPNGKALLFNCSGGSSATFALSSDDSFKAQDKITVKNFRGVNVPSDFLLKIL